jgi:opacity protein-like surface antigen
MKKLLLGSVAVVGLFAASPVYSADLEVIQKAPPALTTLDLWSGLYVGVNAGAAWGSYDPRTSTVAVPGGDINASAGRFNAAGIQSLNRSGFTGGAGVGYNWRSGQFLFGLEADFNYLHLNGSVNSGAVPFVGGSAFQAVISAYGNTNWLFTLRPRAGLVYDSWLFYATGGLAITDLSGDFVASTGNPTADPPVGGFLQSGKIGGNGSAKAGYAIGGGVEKAITDRLRLKAEYLYVNFDRTFAATTATNSAAQIVTQSADLTANIVRVGLNYRLDGPDAPAAGGARMPVKAPIIKAPTLITSDWEFDVGARMWFGSGNVGAPQPLLGILSHPTIRSRLIYSDLDAYSGETFARVDHSSGLFVKGFMGAGAITRGNLNDEDFPAGNAYSNTLLSASGHLAYANIDVGYTFLKAPGAKVGAFVGYNYYSQRVDSYGCTQLAGSTTCASGTFPPNFPTIVEDDRFNSMRVGLSSQFMLTDRLKLTADAAYLPRVNFKGQDDHNARELVQPEQSPRGNGVMLEAVLDYKVTEAWNIGVGGRYWAWNMRDGTTIFNFLGATTPPIVEAVRFNSERYGVFVQTSYHWGDTTAAAAYARMPTKGPPIAAAPMNWTGFYIGGHVGGGWSDDRWSDPFGSSLSGRGGIDVAGFGDKIHAAGPLVGGQVGINWQNGQWVFGVVADANATDIRGENTCFSGIGGINCQRIVNSLGTVAGRVGFAWDRSLIYAKGGSAWTNTTYNLNGDTAILVLGTGTTAVNKWGWTVGAGIEYAVTDNWTTQLEWNHIDVSSVTVPFPTVAMINTQNISVAQSINLIKLGVNYKFNWAGPVVASY